MTYKNLTTAGLLIAAMALAGCGDKSGTPTTGGDKGKGVVKDGGKKGGDHAHGKGPNGGVVFDLGKYHAEVSISHSKKEFLILILGDDEMTPLAVAAKELTVTTKETKGKKDEVVKAMTINLKPVDEKDGKATKYVGTDAGLAVEAEHAGTITGEIDGKPSSGEFKE